MPSTVTHAIFAVDVLKKSIVDSKFYIEDYLKVFAQGPDPINFYNLYVPFSNKYVRDKYPLLLHTSKTKDKFLTIIKYIIDNELMFDISVMSFLYGIICHYFLDSTIHPYIIYFSGKFYPDDKSTYEYRGRHSLMEVSIDLYMIEKYLKINPKKFKFRRYFGKSLVFDSDLTDLLDYSYNKVYDINDFSKIYFKSIKDMKFVDNYFRTDRFGIKRNVYKLFDFFTPKYIPLIESLSYYGNVSYDYLNLDNKKWCHICNKNEIYNYSFLELYDIAFKKCVEAINIVYNVIYNDLEFNKLNDIFLNLSYTTGKNCNNKVEPKYFINITK